MPRKPKLNAESTGRTTIPVTREEHAAVVEFALKGERLGEAVMRALNAARASEA